MRKTRRDESRFTRREHKAAKRGGQCVFRLVATQQPTLKFDLVRIPVAAFAAPMSDFGIKIGRLRSVLTRAVNAVGSAPRALLAALTSAATLILCLCTTFWLRAGVIPQAVIVLLFSLIGFHLVACDSEFPAYGVPLFW